MPPARIGIRSSTARGLFDEVRTGREVLYVLPRKTRLVDVFVTPATLARALKLASELFLFLEDRGQRVVLAPPGRDYRRASSTCARA